LPITQICAAPPVALSGPIAVQIGGSARGYQELSAPLAILAKAGQAGGWPYVYASSALGVNARICR
jgi:hypothetical protein